MSNYVQVFRGKVDPDDAARLAEIRPKAIAEAQAACPELLHADLVRVDDDTWLDILTWSRPDGAEMLMASASGLTALAEMHSLLAQVVEVQLGELVHSTRA